MTATSPALPDTVTRSLVATSRLASDKICYTITTYLVPNIAMRLDMIYKDFNAGR